MDNGLRPYRPLRCDNQNRQRSGRMREICHQGQSQRMVKFRNTKHNAWPPRKGELVDEWSRKNSQRSGVPGVHENQQCKSQGMQDQHGVGTYTTSLKRR
ncbi:unnamed protein product [Nezara viridula]|uniref:Uncharacterized protein n=1 Tax=Nezara viridula TaxID=85310 RepID=A0A9P0MUK4_NEZVI|nr:unnamed protein product [Nezara viridula]